MRSKTKVLLAAGLAIGLGALSASGAQAAALGYGSFLGEWEGNVTTAADIKSALGTTHNYTQMADVNFNITEFKYRLDGLVEPIGGTWDYLKDVAINMLVVVDYGKWSAESFSIFDYSTVNPGDNGVFASDPALTGSPMSTAANGKALAISQVSAWTWSDGPLTAVPLPPAMLLFASALAALGAATRLRRKEEA